MHVPAVSLVLLSTLLVFNAEPQLGRYPVPYAPSFRGYFFQPHYPNFRHYAEFPQRVSSNNQPRFIFLESTYVTTTTTTTVYNCRYSTAVLAACRRKRSVEEDAHDIVPSAVARLARCFSFSLLPFLRSRLRNSLKFHFKLSIEYFQKIFLIDYREIFRRLND